MFVRMHGLDIVERVRPPVGDRSLVSHVVVATVVRFGPLLAVGLFPFSPEPRIVRVPYVDEIRVLWCGGMGRKTVG
jgi:hypothetical protein